MARRVDATAYVDVFAYLSSETRRTVVARLVPARVTFDAVGRRGFSTEEGGSETTEGLEALLREVEIASMAKVWAHPDDLASIIRGIRAQEARHGARMVSWWAAGVAGCRWGWGWGSWAAGLPVGLHRQAHH